MNESVVYTEHHKGHAARTPEQHNTRGSSNNVVVRTCVPTSRTGLAGNEGLAAERVPAAAPLQPSVQRVLSMQRLETAALIATRDDRTFPGKPNIAAVLVKKKKMLEVK